MPRTVLLESSSKRPRSMLRALAWLAAASLMLGACAGQKSTTAKTAPSVAPARGEVRFGRGAVDPASLGLPLYPGATESDTSVSLNAGAKNGSRMVTLATVDSFDRVYAFYQTHMPAGSEKGKVSSGGVQMATFQIGDAHSKDARSVVIQAAGTKVVIQLVHAVRTR